MKDCDPSSDASAPSTGYRARRMSLPALPSFPHLPAQNEDNPRLRTNSMESGWLKKFVRRPSMDMAGETSNISPIGSVESVNHVQEISDKVVGGSLGGLAHTGSNHQSQPGLTSRKSESMLWKWFNTSMQEGHSVTGQKISELAEASDSPSLCTIPQQSPQQAYTESMVNKDFDKFGPFKLPRKLSARDLNAVSPSQW